MVRSQRAPDAWLHTTVALLATYAGFVALVYMRPGLLAVLLWYTVPVLVLIAAVSLLIVAFVRSWRSRQPPSPRQLAGYAALLAVVLSLSTFRVYPSSHDEAPSRVPFRVPLDGPVTVAWGGPTLAENYHAVMPDQRWAYDLLVTRNGVSFRDAGTRPEDYYAYGRDVLAPAEGLVRRVRDGEPDGSIGQRRLFGAFGNHIVLEVAAREFLFIAHLQPGSIDVRSGDRVSAGDVIGRVGNSGNSSEPHVHLHLQDRPTASLGEAIPFLFHHYRLAGTTVTWGMPRGGRTDRTRVRTGVFTGDVIEHLDRREAHALDERLMYPPLPSVERPVRDQPCRSGWLRRRRAARARRGARGGGDRCPACDARRSNDDAAPRVTVARGLLRATRLRSEKMRTCDSRPFDTPRQAEACGRTSRARCGSNDRRSGLIGMTIAVRGV